jgi:hypothetical protein
MSKAAKSNKVETNVEVKADPIVETKKALDAARAAYKEVRKSAAPKTESDGVTKQLREQVRLARKQVKDLQKQIKDLRISIKSNVGAIKLARKTNRTSGSKRALIQAKKIEVLKAELAYQQALIG